MDSTRIPPEMAAIEADMIALRRRLHAHPELGFEERATSDLVADCLTTWGYQVTRGLGGTGVVGTLTRGAGRRLGLRADMDALPIRETTGLPHASRIDGVMHACGHDGHTAMLLAAARCLAERERFRGTLNLIFQPAEEGLGGAQRMIDDGLFARFPCDAVFAMHNVPGLPAGKLGFCDGPFMASADEVRVRVTGRGGHGAAPHAAVDPVVVCASIVMALQTIVSRNVNPQALAIITAGSIHAGTASNVIPPHADLELSVRALSPDVRALLERRIRETVAGQAASYGATAEIDYRVGYPVLVNHADETAFARQVARDWGGDDALIEQLQPIAASEDFAFMLNACPGSYLSIGNGDGAAGCALHNPGYDFNDAILATGASYWVALAERFLG
ncbi:amidohydrolase [Burkholderia ubonensis]|uniref:Amidohydrolase n=1 Tax=Burkholderia ubonensis TaxID=101571 RepID=A0A102L9Z9_9BURK|nr:M20 aminoacylase family protein [Burkholderia ubonensis]KUZ69360.1 amidohydrolase [Burkholderia ubonensis]KUZ89696.1 amidohydrolase [Burkholderia ubonensis]KVA03468.1 amidohydrolase [Burkholderia ubonensis]